MVTLLKIENGQPIEWIQATDMDDARRQAQMAGRMDIATALYRLYGYPPPALGKYTLPTGEILLIG